ncbi:MAG: DNA ligase [Aquabacterium sp.]|nr:DNA ligase [Aquabacterium sp.]
MQTTPLTPALSTLRAGAVPGGMHRRAWLTAAFAAAVWPASPVLAAMPGIPLALDAPDSLQPAGYLVSEKYDGVRALWDGRQLRFRSGLLVPAPASFLQRLPPVPLDGELWLGRGQFEALSGLVRRRDAADADWRGIRYMVFDMPWAEGGFARRHALLQALLRQHGDAALEAVPQATVPDRAALLQQLDAVVRAGGEGLMLRRADAPYAAGRSAAMLKLKPLQDADAVVLAHLPGRGRHAGRMGALQVRTDSGQVFHIGTGFSDAERDAPPAPGQRITFAYRGLTEAGVPRFASFLRVRPAGL